MVLLRCRDQGLAKARPRPLLMCQQYHHPQTPLYRHLICRLSVYPFDSLLEKAAAPAGAGDKGLTLASKTSRLGKTVVYLKGACEDADWRAVFGSALLIGSN